MSRGVLARGQRWTSTAMAAGATVGVPFAGVLVAAGSRAFAVVAAATVAVVALVVVAVRRQRRGDRRRYMAAPALIAALYDDGHGQGERARVGAAAGGVED